MGDYDTRMELASRDIVARAIYEQMMQGNQPHVMLDISHRPAHEVLEHFPTIAQRVSQAGFDITKEPIPVAPVQHYMCGGVQVRLYGLYLNSSAVKWLGAEGGDWLHCKRHGLGHAASQRSHTLLACESPTC